MDTPETTLKCYEEYTRKKDVAALKTIYWELKDFQFSDLVYEEYSYKILEKTIYTEDLKLENYTGEVPVWAKKGNVELVSEQYTNGQKGVYSHTFREIDGKWYMVGHYQHGLEDFAED